MIPANNPDLAVAQEWFYRLSNWLQQQKLADTLSQHVVMPKLGTSYIRFSLFGSNSVLEEDEVYNSLVVLQAHLAEANNEIWMLTGEDIYKDNAAKYYDSLVFFTQQLAKETDEIEAPGLQVILHVWEALLSSKMSQHNNQPVLLADSCKVAIETLYKHFLKNTNGFSGNDNPSLSLRFAAALCRSADLLPYKDVEDGITELLPEDIAGFFAARRKAINRLSNTVCAIEALYILAKGYPGLVSSELPRQLLRTFLAELLKNGTPLLDKKDYPVTARDAADLILVLSRLGEQFSEARDKAILPLRWASYYLQDTKSGAPYAFRFPRRSVKTPAYGYDCTRMYLALSTYLRCHFNRLGASMSNAFTD